MKKFFIQTWGCQMNEYDSSRLIDLMCSSGYVQTEEISEGDVVILITCAIREKAQEKVFNQLFSWKHKKQYKENAVVCLGGCVASQEGEKILKRAPMVGVVFGPQTIHRVPSMIDKVIATGERLVDVTFPPMEKFDFLPNPNAHGSASAFVTIMEGCSNFCTYCVVPHTRGTEISRNVPEIIAEIAHLTSQGVKEINLIGQNVNSFCGKHEDGTVCTFAELLYLVAAVDGVERIRFTTSNPQDFTDEIIQAFADLPQIANALHLPVQNGSNRILKAMNRKYTREHYIEVVRKIREVRPDIYISTDFIVGFPGDPRPNTPAAGYPDDIPLQVKKERLYELQNAINNQAQRYSREMLHTVQKVLVEGISVRDTAELRGRTDNNRTVNFVGDPSLIGTFVDIKITDVLTHTGEIVTA